LANGIGKRIGVLSPHHRIFALKRKHGTPLMPIREAVAISVRTASMSASVGNSVSTTEASMPASRSIYKHGVIAKIGAFLEIQLEQTAHEPVLRGLAGGTAHRMTRCASSVLGATLMAPKAKLIPFGFAQRLDAGVDLADALIAAELGQHVVAAILAFGGMVGSSWNGRQRICTLMSPAAAIALSSRFWPMKHHGQTTSETTSTVMEFISLIFISCPLSSLSSISPQPKVSEKTGVHFRLLAPFGSGPNSVHLAPPCWQLIAVYGRLCGCSR
jgi:hypothetical protein